MLPASSQDQVMKRSKILVILGQQHRSVADGICEVRGIQSTGMPNLSGGKDSMPQALEVRHDPAIRDIIIKVEPHAPEAPLIGTNGGLSKPRARISAKTASRSWRSTSSWWRQ
jgi:hypothetical protein